MKNSDGPVLLDDVNQLANPGAISVIVGEGTSRHDYLVVRYNGAVRVYENACPHQGTPLETLAGTTTGPGSSAPPTAPSSGWMTGSAPRARARGRP